MTGSTASRCPDDPIQAQPTLRGGAGRVRGAAVGADPVRQRRRRRAVPAAVPGFERSFARFPLPGTTARSWYLAAGGALADAKPVAAGTDTFTWSRAARPATELHRRHRQRHERAVDGDARPTSWSQNPAGTAASYVSAPLAADTVVVGAGALEAWIKSPARSVDLQATVTEVRPDGQETFVQSGWLRASVRKLDKKQSTPLEPVLSLRKKRRGAAAEGQVREGDRAALLPGPRLPGGLARAGDHLGRRRPADLGVRGEAPRTDTKVTIARDPRPSRLLLPVVRGVNAPTGLPPCPGLRGEPCRDYTGG